MVNNYGSEVIVDRVPPAQARRAPVMLVDVDDDVLWEAHLIPDLGYRGFVLQNAPVC
jgi:hypothetical protein